MRAEISISQAYIKQHNIERVLTTLDRYQPLTRADIARVTDMSLASVTRVVGVLHSLGLIEEASPADSARRGRKAGNLKPCPDGVYTLGFHMDTANLRMCLMNFANRACYQSAVPLTKERMRPDAVARLARELFLSIPKDAMADAGHLRATGVSLSGCVDVGMGRVIRSVALDWTNEDVGTAFHDALGMPVRVENDVKACLTWEKVRRSIPDEQDVAYLYIGRAGIGFANTANGALVRGRSNASGEIEETRFTMNERLSDHLMERELLKRARAVSPSVSSIRDILCALEMELPWARILMDDFCSHLRVVLQVIKTMLDPHVLIIGGDVPEAFIGHEALLPEGDHRLSDRFEESCANGAAMVAMREAVHRMISDKLGPEQGGEAYAGAREA